MSDKYLPIPERFAIGFTSSMLLPFLKLYQNGSLLVSSNMDYYLGLLVPFVFLLPQTFKLFGVPIFKL